MQDPLSKVEAGTSPGWRAGGRSIPDLRIGQVHVGMPVVQAALSGYSDWAMRRLAREMGAPYTIHEVMIDRFVSSLKNRERTRHFLHVEAADRPVGGQLMGTEPEEFKAAASRLVDAGFDVIDINFGCPMKRLRGKCRGGLHLSQPEEAARILEAVRNHLPDHVPMTLKMRCALDESPESEDNAHRILEAAVALSLDAVTVHGRTVAQRYVGPSRWSILRQLKQQYPGIRLLGSGDLFTAPDCVRMLEETGVDGVTVARGAIGNPWIFEQCRALLTGRPLPAPPSVHEQRAALERHLVLQETMDASGGATRQLRKFGIYYSRWHPRHEDVRQAFIRAARADEWKTVIADYYTEDGPGRGHPEVSRELHSVNDVP